MKASMFLSTAGAALLAGLVSSPASAAPSEQCNTESVQAMAPADTTVSIAVREGGGCRVMGYVTTRNPGPNKVHFTLGLPDNFNGRYVFLGVGGAAGNVPPLRPQLLGKGYALAGTDAGTGAKNLSDFTFRKDAAKAADFLGRGVRVSADATQHIARNYYKPQTPIRRYISGCSGGGQMGLRNALQSGTQYFDGFIVGATPWPGTVYMPNAYRIGQYLQTHPEGYIPPDMIAKADAAILAAYDATDGATDGIIFDQRNIKKFDVGILRKVGFTPAQIATFDMLRNPYRFTVPGEGERVHPGYPVTDVGGWAFYLTGRTPPPYSDLSRTNTVALAEAGVPFMHIMADANVRSYYPDRSYWKAADMAELTRLALETGSGGEDHPTEAAFGKLASSGAKMIVYHGVDDDAMSYLETIQSHQRIAKMHPDIDNWLRVFSIPGMRHCSGGAGPTDIGDPLLDALVNWVEKNQAPDEIIATRVTPARGVERTFRLCSEPKRAFLRGAGFDPTRAESWECRTSAS